MPSRFLPTHLLLALCFFPLSLFGSWYNQKLEGWYYFEDPHHPQNITSLTPEEAESQLNHESHRLKQLLSLAILVPSPTNVENYMQAQRFWIQQSSRFAKMWGKTLLTSPELGEFLTTPTSSYGILAKRSHDLQKRQQLLHDLSHSYFLLFFFKGSDALASKALEAAQTFTSTHGWTLKAVSLDGIGLPLLPAFETDQGISHHFGVQLTPSFFIVDPTQNKAYPVGTGLIAVSEIEHNIAFHLMSEEAPEKSPGEGDD